MDDARRELARELASVKGRTWIAFFIALAGAGSWLGRLVSFTASTEAASAHRRVRRFATRVIFQDRAFGVVD
jgi:hypothetical protein